MATDFSWINILLPLHISEITGAFIYLQQHPECLKSHHNLTKKGISSGDFVHKNSSNIFFHGVSNLFSLRPFVAQACFFRKRVLEKDDGLWRYQKVRSIPWKKNPEQAQFPHNSLRKEGGKLRKERRNIVRLGKNAMYVLHYEKVLGRGKELFLCSSQCLYKIIQFSINLSPCLWAFSLLCWWKRLIKWAREKVPTTARKGQLTSFGSESLRIRETCTIPHSFFSYLEAWLVTLPPISNCISKKTQAGTWNITNWFASWFSEAKTDLSNWWTVGCQE